LGSAGTPPSLSGAVVNPLQHAHSPYVLPNTNIRESQNFVCAGARPLWVGTLLTPKNKPHPYMCYHVKFGSSAAKGVRISIRKPPKLGSTGALPPLGWVGARLTLYKYAPPHVCYSAKFGHSRSNGKSVIKEIHLKKT